MTTLLTKELLQAAADLVTVDHAFDLTGYTCIAVAKASGDGYHYAHSPATKEYVALAIEAGAVQGYGPDRLSASGFTVLDANGNYDLEASNTLRFDFLNLLAESL